MKWRSSSGLHARFHSQEARALERAARDHAARDCWRAAAREKAAAEREWVMVIEALLSMPGAGP